MPTTNTIPSPLEGLGCDTITTPLELLTAELPVIADASDAPELLDELKGRFELMLHIEEGRAGFLPEGMAEDNRAEALAILEALTSYVLMGRVL